MADPETERAIGRIEGRLGAMETRIGDVLSNALDRIEANDKTVRPAIDALWAKVNELAGSVATLKSQSAHLDGEKSAMARLVDMALKALPLLGGGSVGAVVMWAIRK